jgi:hypothetical protein
MLLGLYVVSFLNLLVLIINAIENKIFLIKLAILEMYSKAMVSLVLSLLLMGIKKLNMVAAQYNNNAVINQKDAVL